ncbi:MAG: histidinol-phosphate transaminase [Eubacteriaceae bacterium]|nr:histidinol-phosphate transaminase [Eubacteriaceae bacterium]
MSRFINEQMKNLAPYTPGEQPKSKKLIKLNTNENPYPPSPKVKEAVSKLDKDEYRLYPDPDTGIAIRAIAEYYGLDDDMIAMGNGSDELLAFAYMAYGGKVYFPETSYGFYPVFGDMFGCEAFPIGMTDDLRIDPACYDKNDGLIVIANPNAPTGMAVSEDDIEMILKNNPDQVVVVDEAYVDFGAETCVPLTKSYDNLLVVQTFSKSRSLAGMRIGFAMANRALIDDINRVKFSFNPYNLSREAIVAAKAAIEDDEYFKLQCGKVIETREKFIAEMNRLGYETFPSSANFVFVKTGPECFDKLREHDILVRHWDLDLIKDYIRVTIGRDEDMEELVRVMEEIK